MDLDSTLGDVADEARRDFAAGDRVRKPLAKGDDGSGDRYPTRAEVIALEERVEAATREHPVAAIIPPAWDAPVPATDDAYDVRVTVDGDELQLPFKILRGRDYALGDDLKARGFVTARTVIALFPPNYWNSVRVTIFPIPCPDRTGCTPHCEPDNDPLPVADVAIER